MRALCFRTMKKSEKPQSEGRVVMKGKCRFLICWFVNLYSNDVIFQKYKKYEFITFLPYTIIVYVAWPK